MIVLVVAAIGVLFGCGEEVSFVTWEPLEVERVLSELTEPTATLVEFEAVATETARSADQQLRRLRNLEQVLNGIEAYWAPSDAPPAERAGERKRGTSVFVEVACPGDDPSAPTTDFTDGFFRFDSPALSFEELEAAQLAGDGLVTFNRCRVASTELEGRAPLYYETRMQRLLMEPSVTLSVEGQQEVLIDTPLALSSDRLLFRVVLGGAGTIVVEFDFNRLDDLTVLAADGVVVCDRTGFECSEPPN